jgi:integrase
MFLFKDWSYRFNNLDDIKLNGNVMNERKINSQNIFSDGDISNLLKAETKPFWRAYLMLCYEAGLRTIEGRTIKWEDIKFNIDEDISEIKVFSTKTKTARTCFIKDATFYLKKLQEMQEAEKTKGIYVFNSGRKDKLNNPISKSAVNVWFRRLTKRVLGKELWCYLLRHSRATALYKLAKENKISKDTAISFMGHSNDMSKKYTHLDIEDIKKMMRNQVYNLSELAPEKKASLEKEISELKKQLEGYKICLNEGLQNLKTEFLSVFADTKKIKEKLILAKIK